MSKEQFEHLGLPSSEGMQATIIGSPQRAPKVLTGARHPHAMGWIQAMDQAKRAIPRKRGKRPSSVGTYVRKDSGPGKLIPRK